MAKQYSEEFALVYHCHRCHEEITFEGSPRIYHNLAGTVHLCKDEDKEAYREYCELVRQYYNDDKKLYNGRDFWKWRQDLRQQQLGEHQQSATVYFCYACCREITFHGSRIRYNLDGIPHTCIEEDVEHYRQYRNLIRRYHDNDERLYSGQEYWKFRRDLEEQYQNAARERNKRVAEEEQQRRAAEDEQRRKAAADEQRRKAAADEQQRRKRAANEKRRATRERKKRAAEEEAWRRAAQEQQRRRAAEERKKRRRVSPESQALKVLGLTRNVLRLALQEKLTAIKHAFRQLALKFHPDKGGTCAQFKEINDAYEYLINIVGGSC
ncbi:MAG: DnaJ domain-containing protein [Candidatus Nitrosopolaris sp.]